jgi:hypothetical protein
MVSHIFFSTNPDFPYDSDEECSDDLDEECSSNFAMSELYTSITGYFKCSKGICLREQLICNSFSTKAFLANLANPRGKRVPW